MPGLGMRVIKGVSIKGYLLIVVNLSLIPGLFDNMFNLFGEFKVHHSVGGGDRLLGESLCTRVGSVRLMVRVLGQSVANALDDGPLQIFRLSLRLEQILPELGDDLIATRARTF